MYPHTRKKSLKGKILILLLIFLILPILFLLFIRLEGEKPEVGLNLTSPYLGVTQDLKLNVVDKKSGIRRILVTLETPNKRVELINHHMAQGGVIMGGGRRQMALEQTIEPKKLGLTEGAATLRIEVRDLSWRGWFHGNKTLVERKMTIDFKPPVVTVLTHSWGSGRGSLFSGILRVG